MDKKPSIPKEYLTGITGYMFMFGEEPFIPMMQTTGYNDPKFIRMMNMAIKRGTPLTDEDYEKYFPRDKDSKY